MNVSHTRCDGRPTCLTVSDTEQLSCSAHQPGRSLITSATLAAVALSRKGNEIHENLRVCQACIANFEAKMMHGLCLAALSVTLQRHTVSHKRFALRSAEHLTITCCHLHNRSSAMVNSGSNQHAHVLMNDTTESFVICRCACPMPRQHHDAVVLMLLQASVEPNCCSARETCHRCCNAATLEVPNVLLCVLCKQCQTC